MAYIKSSYLYYLHETSHFWVHMQYLLPQHTFPITTWQYCNCQNIGSIYVVPHEWRSSLCRWRSRHSNLQFYRNTYALYITVYPHPCLLLNNCKNQQRFWVRMHGMQYRMNKVQLWHPGMEGMGTSDKHCSHMIWLLLYYSVSHMNLSTRNVSVSCDIKERCRDAGLTSILYLSCLNTAISAPYSSRSKYM